MFRNSIITASLILSGVFAQAATSCDDYLKSFNEYTQKVEGVLVKKHSIFEITDWSRNSRFQGLVLTAKAPADIEVVLETKANSKAKVISVKTNKTTPFAQDEKYRVVSLDVEKQLGSAPQHSGTYIVRVLASGKELCADKKLIFDDGE
ncbi:hypothetical protein CIK05_02300 [Bdellovibrio sp. qaytius]|nr:hypothetical protein CIK05_02300 [Bdellovibrio sp. qaytius]